MKTIVYVLEGMQNGKRYVGLTQNLERRLTQHRRKETKGGQLLGDFQLLHQEEFPTRPEARLREKWLKSGQGREWLKDQFPTNENHRTD